MKTGGKNEKFAGGKSQLEISGGLPSSGADCKRLELISWRQNNNNKERHEISAGGQGEEEEIDFQKKKNRSLQPSQLFVPLMRMSRGHAPRPRRKILEGEKKKDFGERNRRGERINSERRLHRCGGSEMTSDLFLVVRKKNCRGGRVPKQLEVFVCF